MIEHSWNNAVWTAIENLKESSLDEIFIDCEKELYSLGAPEREINLRLFALALYCNKSCRYELYKSAAFTRFCENLNFSRFKKVVETLVKESNLALIIYWVVLRCSFTHSAYLSLEEEIKESLLSRRLSPMLI